MDSLDDLLGPDPVYPLTGHQRPTDSLADEEGTILDSMTKKEFVFKEITTGSDIEAFPSTAQIIGESLIEDDGILDELDWRQKKFIALTARHLFVMGQSITGEGIFRTWPVGMNKRGKISDAITDPQERGKIFRAGYRPEISQIQRYIKTETFAYTMREFGIEIDPNDTGLTVEQMGLLTYMANFADGKDMRKKLRDAGVPWSKFQAWLSQPDFATAYDSMLKGTIKQAVPFAAQQLAAKMAAGDTAAAKLGFEISGFHDPANKKQVDATLLMQIILEVLEEKIKDKNLLLEIAASFQIRGAKALGAGPES